MHGSAGACRASLFVAYQRPQIPCGRFFHAWTPQGGRKRKGTLWQAYPNNDARRTWTPKRRGAAPAALGADDARFHAPRHRASLARLGLDEPEPAGGLRARARRPHHRRGLARSAGRRTPSATRLPTAHAAPPMTQRMRNAPMTRRPATLPAAMRAGRRPT